MPDSGKRRVMEVVDTQQIAERELERILALAKSRDIDVRGAAHDGGYMVSGITTLIITVAGANAFRIRQDQGNHPGGTQTYVTNQPPRWGESGPPWSLDEMHSKEDQWLIGEAHLARLPVA
jgi:hypothetical protein